MTSSIVRFGLLYGAALGIGFFVSHLILGADPNNFSTGEVVGYSVMIISSLAVIFGIKEYKERYNNGRLGFFVGLGIGLGITTIASAILAVYNWVYLEFINPNFTTVYLEYSEQQILSSGLSADVIEEQLAELAYFGDMMSSNYLQSMLMFVTVLIIGLLFSLTSAAVMRTYWK
jgi:hypothetical protein